MGVGYSENEQSECTEILWWTGAGTTWHEAEFGLNRSIEIQGWGNNFQNATLLTGFNWRASKTRRCLEKVEWIDERDEYIEIDIKRIHLESCLKKIYNNVEQLTNRKYYLIEQMI